MKTDAAAALRVARVAVRTGLVQDALDPALPRLAALVARRGLSVRTIHTLHAILHPARPAIVDPHRTLTYGEADREINRVAHGLRALGVRRREPVVLATENRSEYLVTWFALLRLGAPSVHASWHSTADELEYRLEHSGARVVLISERTEAAALKVRERRPDLDVRFVHVDGCTPTGCTPYARLVEGASERFPARSGGGPNIVYTSGTTGRPKGAVRDFAKFGLVELSRILDRLPLQTGGRHLLVAPMYHSGGQVFTLVETALGATLHVRPRFDPEDALRRLSEEDIESVFLVPTMIRRILDLPEALQLRHPTPRLHALVSGAAPFPRQLRERAVARFGAENVYDFYGATELGWVTLIRGDEMQARPGSLGRPIPGQEIRILGEDGRGLPPGEVGVVHVRSRQLMSGYLTAKAARAGRSRFRRLRRGAATGRDGDAPGDAATGEGAPDTPAHRRTRRRGWLTVGDLGFLDADGHLHLVGRAKDMVISGGVNVYPLEVEEVLARHPAVRDVAVLGVPDETWGERLVAFVVAGDGFDPEAVTGWAREHLSAFKIPKDWRTVAALPRNPTGKVLKGELRARLTGET